MYLSVKGSTLSRRGPRNEGVKEMRRMSEPGRVSSGSASASNRRGSLSLSFATEASASQVSFSLVHLGFRRSE